MSAAQIIGAVAGVIVGVVTENPYAGFATYSAISGIGAYLEQPDRYGPRLEDLRTQMSVYGAPIPFEYGCNRHAGTVIWPRILEAVEHEHSESAKGGPEQKTFSYTLSFAVLITEGPIAGVRRIWANKKLVYDFSSTNDGATEDPAISSIRIYLGTEDQEVDPLIAATEGPSPAYLGYAYAVFEGYDVTEMNGRPPQFEFEVIQAGSAALAEPTLVGVGGSTILFTNPGTSVQSLCTIAGDQLYIYNPETLDLIQQIALPFGGLSITTDNSTALWVGYSNPPGFYPAASQIDLQMDGSFALGATLDFGSGSAITRYGTVVWGESTNTLYGFINNGIGAGGRKYPANDPMGIIVPNWVYTSVEMPDRDQIAVVGYGRWMVIADVSSDSTVATIENFDWGANVEEHRIQYDAARSCIYWATIESGNVYKVNLDTYDLTQIITVSSIGGMHYDANTDKIYVDSSGDLLIYSVDGDLLETRVGQGILTGYWLGSSISYNDEFYFVSEMGGTGSDKLWRIPIGGRINPDQVLLSDIVSDICYRAGLTEDDIDVSQLTDGVDGYIVSHQMTARAALEPLQKAYYFDAVESDDKIKFVKRGSATTTLIPIADRAAHAAGQDMPANLEIVRAFETELPIQLDVEYADVDADHQVGNQYDRRITKDTRNRANIQLPIVMHASKAKEIARVNLYDAWQTGAFRFSTTRKYAYLEPTDRLELPNADATYFARITSRRDQPSGVIEWEAREDAVEVYSQSGADAITPPYSPQVIFEPSTTVLELLDIPILRDEDQNGGFYIAMCGTTSNWPGAEVFRSADDGSTYNSILVHSIKTPIGTASTALANFDGGNVFDDANTVTVHMIAGATLSSYTESQVLEGYGVCALGAPGRWEILHYTVATLVSANTYELSGLLRGRRGTEWAMGTHQEDDTFVFGSEAAWRLYSVPSSDLNISRLYKAPAFRTRLSDAAYQEFTDRAIRRRPYSVAHLKTEPLNDGGYTVSWIHRSLINSSWATGFSVPLDTTFESFNITISSVDGVVIRRFTTAEESFPYSATDITGDFGGMPPVILIRVAQRNTDYGDGVGTTIRTDTGELIYDFSDPFSGTYTPPDVTAPPTPPVVGVPIPPGNQWFGPDYWPPALWDGVQFVASNVYGKGAPDGGAMWTSTDGLTFTQLGSNTSGAPLMIAAHYSGHYVNQSGDRHAPWYSTDLENWTRGTWNAFPSGYPYEKGALFSKVIHDGTRFVGLVQDGEIVSSSDNGATWSHDCNVTTAIDTSGIFSGNGDQVWGYAYGDGVYVAVGYGGDQIWSCSTYNGTYTAQTGAPIVTYSSVDYPAYLYSVEFCADDGYFYAVGAKRHFFTGGYSVSTGVIIRSTDGATWTDVTPSPTIATGYVGSIAYRFYKLTGGYVVVGSSVYFTSSDGAIWTEHALSPYNQNQLYASVGNGGWHGVDNGTILATQERQWLFRDVTTAGVMNTYTDQYRKPITFDGSTFDPTLDSPYP